MLQYIGLGNDIFYETTKSLVFKSFMSNLNKKLKQLNNKASSLIKT